MTCPICSYHWCWTCGMSYFNPLHMISGFGLMCEVIGAISFSKSSKKCKAIQLTFCFLCFPFLFWLLCTFISGAMFTTAYDKLHIFSKIQILGEILENGSSEAKRKIGCLAWVLYASSLVLIIYPLYILAIALWLALTLGVGTASFAVLVIPAFLVSCYSMLRKLYIWRRSGGDEH